MPPGALTLFPYQNPQGCHAARRTQNDAPSKAQDVSAVLLQSVVDVDGAVGSDVAVDVAAAAAAGDDDVRSTD